MQFFDISGALLASITQPLSRRDALLRLPDDSRLVIAAVSLTNTDPAGIAYDNVQFYRAVVPEPATLLRFVSAVGARGARRFAADRCYAAGGGWQRPARRPLDW